MKTYSLLQIALDQSIDRTALEEASVGVPTVARADCAGIADGLFGIVVSGLPQADAVAFQAALKQRGFPTRLVEDREIPTLHEPFAVQRILLEKNTIGFTDSMGRGQSRPIAELVFVAGGFLTDSRSRSVTTLDRSGQSDSSSRIVREERKQVPEFRLDFFFSSAPHRLRAVVSAESTAFFGNRPLRLRDNALLLGTMMDLREILPADRVGEGLQQHDTEIFYPSLRCYEEEIRWHFHRLKTSA